MTGLIGSKFGKLVVLRQKIPSTVYPSGGRYPMWFVQCDCGKTLSVRESFLKSGKTKSCGCSRIKDLTGRRFGRLIATQRAVETASNGNSIWIMKCDCGTICRVNQHNLVSKKTTSCGCFLRELQNSQRLTPEKFEKVAIKYLFKNYQKNAIKRNKAWGILYGLFSQLVKQPCHYCESPPQSIQRINGRVYLYSGLDRKDNTAGYLPENVVPACKFCQFGKRTYSYEDFLAYLMRVGQVWGKKQLSESIIGD